MNTPAFLHRYGNFLPTTVLVLSTNAKPAPRLVSAHSELTGYVHRIQEAEVAGLFILGTLTYSRATFAKVILVRGEHQPIELPNCVYLVSQQREYTLIALYLVLV